MFVNEEKYIVVSNLSDEDYTLRLAAKWTDRRSGELKDTFTIKPGKIIFLKK